MVLRVGERRAKKRKRRKKVNEKLLEGKWDRMLKGKNIGNGEEQTRKKKIEIEEGRGRRG